MSITLEKYLPTLFLRIPLRPPKGWFYILGDRLHDQAVVKIIESFDLNMKTVQYGDVFIQVMLSTNFKFMGSTSKKRITFKENHDDIWNDTVSKTLKSSYSPG